VRGHRRVASGLLAALVLLFALPSAGQVQVGDNLNMNLTGTLSGGYSASYGNMISSSHGMNFGGTGTLSGFYYNPNFLSFSVAPYYGQSRANSNYQSIFDSSGVNLSTSIFSGSHFPGSISYAKSYNSQGSFAIPGLPDYTTHGDSDTFGITWSENLPDVPSLSASYQRGNNHYSIVGADNSGSSTFDSYTLRSGYVLSGFNLGGYFQHGSSDSVIPQLFGTQEQPEQVNSDNTGYGFNVSHLLPLHGSFSAAVNRSDFSSDFVNSNYSGTIDTISTNVGVQPTNKLHLAVGANYSDSLSGQLFQNFVSQGVPIPQQELNQTSHGLDLDASAAYAVLPNLQTQVDVERREQRFLGQDYGANVYSAGVTYGRGLFGGYVNSAVSLRDSRLDQSDQNVLGFTTNLSYNRRFARWFVSGSFSYAQNVETLLVTYMSSFYNYSGNVRRRWGQFSWSASAGASRTGLTVQPGTESTSQSYTTGVGYGRWINASGTYSKSDGNAIETGAGLITTPNPTPIPSSLLILYGGRSYSFGLGSSPLRKLTISGSFAKANSNTLLGTAGSFNSTQQLNTYFQYQFRKMYLTGGFSRLQQGFSATGMQPAVVSSYYFGISRWFNFF
jgi:hypothetical protein